MYPAAHRPREHFFVFSHLSDPHVGDWMSGVHSTVDRQGDGTFGLYSFAYHIHLSTYKSMYLLHNWRLRGIKGQVFRRLSYMQIHLVGECMSVYISGWDMHDRNFLTAIRPLYLPNFFFQHHYIRRAILIFHVCHPARHSAL